MLQTKKYISAIIIVIAVLSSSTNLFSDDDDSTSAEFKKKYNEMLARSSNTDALDFRLVDQDGSPVSLSDHYDQDQIHIVAVHPDCDGKNFVKKVQKHFKIKDKKKNFKILFLNSDSAVTRERYAKMFPRQQILMDDYEQISNSLSFKKIGDFVTLNPKKMKLEANGNLFEVLKLKTNNTSACKINYHVYKTANFKTEVLPSLSRACLSCHLHERSLNYFKSLQSVKSWKEMMLKTLRLKRMPPGADPYYEQLMSDLTIDDLLKVTKWLESGVSVTDEEVEIFQKFIQDYKDLRLKQVNSFEGTAVNLISFPDEKVEASGDSYYKQYLSGPTTEDYYFSHLQVDLNVSVAHHVVLHFLPHPFKAVDLNGKPIDGNPLGYQLYENNPEPITGVSNNGKVKGKKFNDPQIIHIYPTPIVQSAAKGSTFFIPKGSYLNYEVHYNPSGVPEKSPVKVQVFISKKNATLPKAGRIGITLADKTLIAKPNQKNVKISVNYITKESYKITGFGIHTHYRGRSGKLYVQRPNEKKPKLIMSYPTHQYKIKRSNGFKNDYYVPKGSKIITEINFDNSAEHLSNPDPSVPIYIGPSIMNDENFLPRIFTKEF